MIMRGVWPYFPLPEFRKNRILYLAAGAVFLLALYYVKSKLGIDFLPHRHLLIYKV